MSERDFEKEATEMGWRPQEEWNGDPDKWRPAQEFVERGEKLMPILRKENQKLRAEMTAMTQGIKAELEKVKKETFDKATRDFEMRLAALKQEQRAAVEEGDTDKFDKVGKQIEDLKAPTQPTTDPQPQVNPVFVDWNKKNPWYAPDVTNIGEGGDKDMTLFANGVATDISAREPGISPDKLYEQVEKRVKEVFAHKFTNPNREQPSAAESGTPAKGKGGRKSWSALPPEAKQAYDRAAKRLKGQGIDYKKEDYVKEYFEEE